MATRQPDPQPKPGSAKRPIELPQTIFFSQKRGTTPAEPPPERAH